MSSRKEGCELKCIWIGHHVAQTEADMANHGVTMTDLNKQLRAIMKEKLGAVVVKGKGKGNK